MRPESAITRATDAPSAEPPPRTSECAKRSSAPPAHPVFSAPTLTAAASAARRSASSSSSENEPRLTNATSSALTPKERFRWCCHWCEARRNLTADYLFNARRSVAVCRDKIGCLERMLVLTRTPPKPLVAVEEPLAA
jgi:hypothetical protein